MSTDVFVNSLQRLTSRSVSKIQ